MSIYRFVIPDSSVNRFYDLLSGIRTFDNKISMIDPGNYRTRIHASLTDEEATFLKLSIKGLKVIWLAKAKNV